MKLYYKTNISIAHKLALPYKSACQNLHGHNYKVELLVIGSVNEHGMIIDFAHLKKEIMKYDHLYLNDVIKQPTIENFSEFLLNHLKNVFKVEKITSIKLKLWETENSFVENCWVKEDN